MITNFSLEIFLECPDATGSHPVCTNEGVNYPCGLSEHQARAVCGKPATISGPLGHATGKKKGYKVRWAEWGNNSPTAAWFAYIVLTAQHRVNRGSLRISFVQVSEAASGLVPPPSRGAAPTESDDFGRCSSNECAQIAEAIPQHLGLPRGSVVQVWEFMTSS
jgi:hypothetical protein